MSKVSVSLDLSFVEPALRYMASPSEASLGRLVAHDAAKGVYAHAVRFGNTDAGIREFWSGLLLRASGDPGYAARARASLGYLEGRGISEATIELEGHLPGSLMLRCRLLGEVGYDIGVVSEGDAYLNLGHPHFASDQRELVYFAVHELHHAGYTSINPPFRVSELGAMRDLEAAARYCTHLEGTAVYAAYGLRRREGGLGHVDYKLYCDETRRKDILQEHAAILTSMMQEPDREPNEYDFSAFGRLSDERLWYVAGLNMAKTIDERLGRDALTGTMVDGPESFFRLYEECLRNPK